VIKLPTVCPFPLCPSGNCNYLPCLFRCLHALQLLPSSCLDTCLYKPTYPNIFQAVQSPVSLSRCLFAFPSNCLPVHLFACQLLHLSSCKATCLTHQLPVCMFRYLSACPATYLPFSYLSACPAAYVPIQLPVCLSSYRSACPANCLFVQLPMCLSSYLSACPAFVCLSSYPLHVLIPLFFVTGCLPLHQRACPEILWIFSVNLNAHRFSVTLAPRSSTLMYSR
jgi:hypothetical protein